jgi:8-oxo-dGTP pyrophosphatase MutT (NUDIX family)
MNKYKDKIEVIVRLIIECEGSILLCKNKEANNYYLPGGHVEFGDTLEQTIYKETNEELGWNEKDITSITFKNYLEHSYQSGGNVHNEINMIYQVEIGENVMVESKESHIDFEWVDKNTLHTIEILPSSIIPFIAN